MTADRDSADLLAARLTLIVVRDPEPRTVPNVAYADGSVSTSWADWHGAAAVQRPELYENGGPKQS